MDNIADAIRTMNPWWANGQFQEKGIKKRDAQKDISANMKLRQVKDILGVRRSGKTTLLYLVISDIIQHGAEPKKIIFLSFDEINLITADFDHVEKAIYEIEPYPEYLFLDEVQEKKGWERWVKRLYDTKKFKQIFVSGSNASLLSKDIGTLLSGRHISTAVFPFSFKEFLNAEGWTNFSKDHLLSEKNKLLHYIKEYLKKGGFPETIKKDSTSAEKVLTSTYNDIISRDIAARYGMEREKIDLLAKYLFTNIAKEYSYNSIAKNTGMNIETAERYLEYLKDAFLFLSIDFFSYKLKRQYRQNKKIYAIDTGMRNAVCFRFSEDLGRIYENAVLLELKRRNKEVYYWKDKGEVDFLLKEGLKVKELIQVCVDLPDKNTKARELKGLLDAAKHFKTKACTIITEDFMGEEKINGLRISYMPLWLWLLT